MSNESPPCPSPSPPLTCSHVCRHHRCLTGGPSPAQRGVCVMSVSLAHQYTCAVMGHLSLVHLPLPAQPIPSSLPLSFHTPNAPTLPSPPPLPSLLPHPLLTPIGCNLTLFQLLSHSLSPLTSAGCFKLTPHRMRGGQLGNPLQGTTLPPPPRPPSTQHSQFRWAHP